LPNFRLSMATYQLISPLCLLPWLKINWLQDIWNIIGKLIPLTNISILNLFISKWKRLETSFLVCHKILIFFFPTPLWILKEDVSEAKREGRFKEVSLWVKIQVLQWADSAASFFSDSETLLSVFFFFWPEAVTLWGCLVLEPCF